MKTSIKFIQLNSVKILLLGTVAAIACQIPALATPINSLQAQARRAYAIQPTCPRVPPPGGVTCYTPSTAPRLRRNSQGQLVENWQIFLQRTGHYRGPVTGFYGSLTEEAVKRFQRATGLKADGVIGYATWMAYIRANAD
jgi:murein L,D-transpeptidase YcbB/YkuD